MGVDSSPNALRGFLIEWPLSQDNIWAAQSTYTFFSTLPDVPIPGGDYDLGLTSSGSFESPESIQIKTHKAGGIGKAGFVWKEQTSTDYYGRNAANIISRWDPIIQGNATATITNRLLDCIGLEDGSSLALIENKNTGLGTRSIFGYKRSFNGTITNSSLYSQTSASPDLAGGVCLLPDGSILAAYLRANTANNVANIQTSRSHDGGSTWYLLSSTALPEDIDIGGVFGAGNTGYEVQRIRIKEARGEILLIVACRAHNTDPSSTDIILQYSSTDNGGSFIFVGATDGTVSYYQPDLIVKDDNFYLCFIRTVDSAEILSLPSSVTPIDRSYLISAASLTHIVNGLTIAGTRVNKYFTVGILSSWVDEDGRIYAVFQNLFNNKQLYILQSDNGSSWVYLGGNPATNQAAAAQIYFIDDVSSKPSVISGCSTAGKQSLFYNYVTAASTLTNGVHVVDLGGYSTITQPRLNDYPQDYDFGGYDVTWIPIDAPDATAHYTKTGAGSITINGGYCLFSSTTAQTAYVSSPAFASTAAQGVIARARLSAAAQGDLNRGRGIQIETTDRKVTLYIDTTGMQLYDEYAGAAVGAAVTVSTTSGIEVLISVANNKARFWYRADVVGEKKWIAGANGGLAAGGPVANTTVRFGHLSIHSGVLAMNTYWKEFVYSFGSRTGVQIVDGITNPDDLVPRKYPPKGSSVYIAGGCRISTYDGPGYEGESYTIQKDSTYPIRSMFFANSPTPRVHWRSAAVVSGNIPASSLAFYWDVGIAATAPTNIGADMIGISLQNINFRLFSIERYDTGSASWVNMGSFENSMNHPFRRDGASIVSTSASGDYLQLHEAADWTVILTSGETTVCRRIRTNTQGCLDSGSNHKRAVLQIKDPQSTDPVTGNMHLIPNSCTAVIHAQANIGAAIRIVVSAQPNAENYFQIGNLVAGPVIVARQYSRGRSIEFSGGVQVSESSDNVQRHRETSKGIRTFRIAWIEGVDISDLYDSPPNPDYYTGSTAGGSLPVGSPADAPLTMMGLATYCNESAKPIVYLPSINRSASTTQLFNRKYDHALVVPQGSTEISNVLGEELSGAGAGEVFRVGSIVMRELI